MEMNTFILLFIGVALNALAQIMMKFGLRSIGHFSFSLESMISVGLKILLSPFFMIGFSCYAFSIVFWILTLSRVDVSLAYPMTSLGYVLTATAGFLWLQESVSLSRVLGIIVILLGVFLVSRS